MIRISTGSSPAADPCRLRSDGWVCARTPPRTARLSVERSLIERAEGQVGGDPALPASASRVPRGRTERAIDEACDSCCPYRSAGGTSSCPSRACASFVDTWPHAMRPGLEPDALIERMHARGVRCSGRHRGRRAIVRPMRPGMPFPGRTPTTGSQQRREISHSADADSRDAFSAPTPIDGYRPPRSRGAPHCHQSTSSSSIGCSMRRATNSMFSPTPPDQQNFHSSRAARW